MKYLINIIKSKKFNYGLKNYSIYLKQLCYNHQKVLI